MNTEQIIEQAKKMTLSLKKFYDSHPEYQQATEEELKDQNYLDWSDAYNELLNYFNKEQ